jgi:hypothetical protein
MNRIRAATVPPRSDPEQDIKRSFSLPTARTFSIGGAVRIAATDPDPVIDQIIGRTPVTISDRQALSDPAAEVVFANSSGRLPGDLSASAYAAIDGNPDTSWMPGFGPQNGTWLRYSFDRPVTFDHLNLQVVTDGRHSIPTEITITSGLTSRVVKLPPIPDGKGRPQGSTTTVPIIFPSITGQQVQITIDKTRALKELDYYSTGHQTDPVGIAEVGIPDVVAPPTPSTTTSACLGDLLTVDGTPVDVQVSGSTATALSGGALQVSGCGNSANGITLGPGEHIVQTATSKAEGLDLDSIWLSSASGGSALPLTSAGTISLPTPPTTATARVLHQDRTHVTVQVTGTGTPYWLVLGQSQSAGWKASIRGGANVGSSTLVDGYANGWLVSGPEASGTRVFELSWTPQKVVDLALIASAATLVGSLGVIIIPASFFAWAWTGSRRLLRRRHVVWRRRGSVSDESVVEGTSVPSSSVFASTWAGTGRLLRWPATRWRRRSEPGALEPAGAQPTMAVETAESTSQEESTSARTAAGQLLRWPLAGRRRSKPVALQSVDVEPTVVEEAAPSPPNGTQIEPVEPVPQSRLQALVPLGPELTSIFSTRGKRPRVLFMLVVAVLAGAAAGAVTAPIAAPIVFGAVVLGCLVPWSRLLFVLAPLGLFGATGAYMVVQQQRHQYLSNIGWPEEFPVANTLAWIAVCALLASAVVEIARWRSWFAGAPFRPPTVEAEEEVVIETPPAGPKPVDHTDEVSAEPVSEVVAEPADGQSDGEAEPVPPSTDEELTEVDHTDEVSAEPSTQAAPEPAAGPSTGEPAPIPASTDVPPSGPVVDEPQVNDLEAAIPAEGEDEPVTKSGPRRSAFRRGARWLKSLLPGTLSTRAEGPNGGEPPSDDT